MSITFNDYGNRNRNAGVSMIAALACKAEDSPERRQNCVKNYVMITHGISMVVIIILFLVAIIYAPKEHKLKIVGVGLVAILLVVLSGFSTYSSTLEFMHRTPTITL